MLAAIEEGRRTMEEGTGRPFGAVIVRNGDIVASARNLAVVDRTPTAHAELLAINKACARLDTSNLADCVIYASGQPCLMCLSAIFITGIKKLYYANTYEQAKAIGYQAEPFVHAMCATFNAGCPDTGKFLTTPLLEIVHLPMPEAEILLRPQSR